MNDQPQSISAQGMSCPIPIAQHPNVLLAHGGGGRMMHQLIERMFVSTFSNALLDRRHDGAVIDFSQVVSESVPLKLSFTTDTYVVQPLFFPGGDIGSLAVHGTVNDLAMCGARPLFLSAGFTLEEGLPMETLWRVVLSMQKAAAEAGVQIVTGDTKVVDRGKGDGVFINTAGIGVIEHGLVIAPERVRPDDVLLLSGDIGRHGMAIMAVREGLEFESTIESDSAPLAGLVGELLSDEVEVHCMRDITRGGLATVLNEIAEAAGLEITIEEALIPVRPDVQAACEILGFDPLYVACEGRFVAFVPPSDADRALGLMRSHELGVDARRIGSAGPRRPPPGIVTMKSKIGVTRIVDVLSGEQLPRIC